MKGPIRLAFHLGLAALILGVLCSALWMVADRVIMPKVAHHDAPVCKVPELLGSSPEQARARLQSIGLDCVVDPTPRRSESAPQGMVAHQAPAPGDSVKMGHAVRIWLSSGIVTVQIPQVAGLDPETAMQSLKEAGLVPQAPEFVADSTLSRGKTLRTSPAAGVSVAAGSPVRIFLSLGNKDSSAVADSLRDDSARAQGKKLF